LEKNTNLKINDYKTVRDAAFERLRNAILKGHFKPGERLVESQIAEEMGISRTPIREAIRRLETEKLVVNLPRKGVVVAPLDMSQVKEIFAIRAALEGLAVKLAMENFNHEIIKEMEDILKEMQKGIKSQDLDQIVECNTRFHDCIIKTAGSSKLFEMLQNIKEQIQRFRHSSLSVEGRPQIALEEHICILNHIKEKNTTNAQKMMEQHIENAGKALSEKILKNKR